MTGKKKITGSLEVSGSIVSIEEPLVVETKNILWADLVALRDAGELIPGQQYRITDYVTTTAQANTQSAGHQFDIIVTADDVDKLNENARAVQHEGDTYFANSNLSAWQLKYCLDNDTTRFAWADEENGKGVIYRMVDEWNNDCPYDFKNIQFYHSDDDSYYYTFTVYDDADTEDIVDVSTIQNRFKNDENGYSAVSGNIIKPWLYGPYNEDTGEYSYTAIKLNGIMFINKTSYDSFYGIEGNIFGHNCYGNTFGNDCMYNTFGYGCYSNTFGDSCRYNTFGNYCFDNTFGSSCYSNTFGNNCYHCTFGNECRYLEISDNTGIQKKYISVDSGIRGASSVNQFDLYDSAIANKNYQVTFKKSASGKYLMLWATDTGTMTGKVKDSNVDDTWEDIV